MPPFASCHAHSAVSRRSVVLSMLAAGLATASLAAEPLPAPRAAAAPDREPSRIRLDDPSLLAGIPGAGHLRNEDILAWLADPATHAPLDIELPGWLVPGAGQLADLSNKPLTRGRIELGRQLFFDPRLSADGTVSCASCHEPGHGFSVSTDVAVGVGGQAGTRNPPALLNRIMLAAGEDRQFWDGRASSVEDALIHALTDPTEMAAEPEQLLEKLGGIEGYRLQFESIHGDITWDAVGDSLAAFVHCLVTGDSAFDREVAWRRYRSADQQLLIEDAELAARAAAAREAAGRDPMTEAALRGEQLFFGSRAWCSSCHNGVNFTDEGFHNVGVGVTAATPDLGRYAITGRDEDWGAFKTPTIRGAVFTAPYMHDGSLATLADVVEWYAHAGVANRNLDYRYEWIDRGMLSPQDREDLVAFIEACSGPLPEVQRQRLPQ